MGCPIRRPHLALVLLGLILFAWNLAVAQSTTISGAVYDPRASNALPLPNVLVYASTMPVSAPPSGVQCLTYANQVPSGPNVVSYTYSAVDGTFTLQNIPQNADYTIVIQAGKWQRQFDQSVGAAPVAGLVLNMPANHTQGSIPRIAIATGSADAAECVLRDMGISDSEFTDDNGTVNPGGYIHLYRGSSSSGAEIDASTPSETTLMSSSSILNAYDLVMFPCEGTARNQPIAAGATNLLNFAEAGGRIFATHFSYVWLDPADAAQFGNVADWTTASAKQIGSGVGTVQTDFSDGAVLAQWLQNSGATLAGSPNQIDISVLRTDVAGVVAPAQSWLTLKSGSYNGQTGNPVMQMTFNVPFGAPPAQQCGRVLFNDYHVYSVTDANAVFPTECPNPATHVMSAQEKMLEYALFDLSAFVQPVVAPTLNVTFNPGPLAVKSGDAADELTVNVTNTSATTEIGNSAVLAFSLAGLPAPVTVTAINDPTGGWICSVTTLSCTRNVSLPANSSDSVTLTLSVPSYTALAGYSGQITATVSSVTFSTNPSFAGNLVFQQAPPISWAQPANIVYGTPLGLAQLDAASTIAGAFTYSPAAGSILGTGPQTLTATFSPTDTVDYTTGTASVKLTVIPGTPTIALTASANPVFLTYAVSLTASLPSYASSETGTMTFYSGSSPLGTATVSGGSATLTTTSLAAGAQAITAAYSGDANYGPASSAPIAETVQDFTLAFANGNGSVTTPPGTQAIYTLVVAPTVGSTLPAPVTLSASNLPFGMTASFAPAAVASGSSAATVTMTLTLPGKAASARLRRPLGRGAFPVALGLLLLPVAGRLRKARARLIVLFIMAAALAAGFTGCGVTTTPHSFSFTVTATSGSLSHAVTPGLTVE